MVTANISKARTWLRSAGWEFVKASSAQAAFLGEHVQRGPVLTRLSSSLIPGNTYVLLPCSAAPYVCDPRWSCDAKEPPEINSFRALASLITFAFSGMILVLEDRMARPGEPGNEQSTMDDQGGVYRLVELSSVDTVEQELTRVSALPTFSFFVVHDAHSSNAAAIGQAAVHACLVGCWAFDGEGFILAIQSP